MSGKITETLGTKVCNIRVTYFAPWAVHLRHNGGRALARWMEASWGMATVACRSGLARSVPERYALEAVARRAWLSQRPSAGDGRRADRSK
jgi:hypothetical protein